MQLSKRLTAVAGLIRTGRRLADVGTDHGYIPIYLVRKGICDSAIAMDIGKGPLQRAKEHINRYHLEDRITTRLSDGVNKLQPGEADCMVVAGMGGSLTIHILEEGRELIGHMKECVLQPQSEIGKVRKYLWSQGYAIEEEDMVLEDGKFYPMMRVIPGRKQEIPEELLEVYAQYGQFLLQNRHPVLIDFLKKEYATYHRLMEQLEQQLPKTQERLEELKTARDVVLQAMELVGCIREG